MLLQKNYFFENSFSKKKSFQKLFLFFEKLLSISNEQFLLVWKLF